VGPAVRRPDDFAACRTCSRACFQLWLWRSLGRVVRAGESEMTGRCGCVAAQAWGPMGEAASAVLPDLEAWRAAPKPDHRIAGQPDEAMARIRKTGRP
jgi:hypothetical protein